MGLESHSEAKPSVPSLSGVMEWRFLRKVRETWNSFPPLMRTTDSPVASGWISSTKAELNQGGAVNADESVGEEFFRDGGDGLAKKKSRTRQTLEQNVVALGFAVTTSVGSINRIL